MALQYSSYNSTFETLARGSWSDKSVCKIQFLDGTHSYSAGHTKLSDVQSSVLGSPHFIAEKVVQSNGALTCTDITVSERISPVFAVIYLETSNSTPTLSNELLFHVRLNAGDTLDFDGRLKLQFGSIAIIYPTAAGVVL